VEYNKALDEGNLEEALDALIDLVYVALGAAYAHGFRGFNCGFSRVHAANMKKVRCLDSCGSKRNSTLDFIKPTGWRKPFLKDLVK